MSKLSAASNQHGVQPWRSLLLAVLVIGIGGGPGEAGAQTTTNELHTVSAVRDLSVEQTQQKIPVRLQGVVTFFDESLFSHFIQDGTAGIYLQFQLNVAPPMLAPGQLVEVTGVASPGEYAPVVVVDRVRVTGEMALPAAKPVTYEQLASGTDWLRLPLLKAFQKSDLYSKDAQVPDPKQLQQFYRELMDTYFPPRPDHRPAKIGW